jgi:hypothetical protein
VRNFYGLGALGKFLIVIPEQDLVVVLLNHTEFPPNGSTMPLAEYNKLPSVPLADVGTCLGCSSRRSTTKDTKRGDRRSTSHILSPTPTANGNRRNLLLARRIGTSHGLDASRYLKSVSFLKNLKSLGYAYST